MALSTKVVDLVRLLLLDDPDQVGAVGEIAVVQHQSRIALVRILIQVIDPSGVEAAGPALDPVHQIALLQQKLRQVTAVLACNACDQGSFGSSSGGGGHEIFQNVLQAHHGCLQSQRSRAELDQLDCDVINGVCHGTQSCSHWHRQVQPIGTRVPHSGKSNYSNGRKALKPLAGQPVG